MFEFDCKVTQNISINIFLSLKINNFYILQQYSTKIPAYLLPHCKITMGGRRKICFLFSNNVEISFDGGVGEFRCFLLTLHFKTGLVPICKRNRI